MDRTIGWQLLAKYLSGECTAQETDKVETWISNDPNHGELVEILKMAWDTSEPEINTSETYILWQQLRSKAGIDPQSRESALIPFKKSAEDRPKWGWNLTFPGSPVWQFAALLLVFLISALYLFRSDLTSLLGINGSKELTTISPGNGQRESITLSDGSKITLDAGGTCRFPAKFSSDKREVFLSGEAYFNVTSQPDKPFIVVVNRSAIRVLGTKFNIRAWEQEQKMTVTVAEGEVLFYPEKENPEKYIALTHGYAGGLNENGQLTQPYSADIGKTTGWMRNEMYFEDVALSEILNQLERWYDIKFEIQDSAVTKERLTVHLDNRPFEDQLQLLGELVNGHFIRRGNLYRLIPT